MPFLVEVEARGNRRLRRTSLLNGAVHVALA